MDVATLLTPFLFGKKKSSYQSKEKYYSSGSPPLARAAASQRNNKFLFPLTVFLSERKRVKGQMFFIAAIFMIIGMVMLRGVLLIPTISQEKTFQETSYLDRNMGNIQREYEIIAGVASAQSNASSSGAAYMHNFSRLIRSDFDAKLFYVLIVSNGTDQSFTANIGNFMQNSATGTLAATGSVPSSVQFSLNDMSNATYSFAGTAAWTNITLNYTVNGAQALEVFYFNDSSRNYVAGFFDVQLHDSGMLVRSKNYYNRTW